MQLPEALSNASLHVIPANENIASLLLKQQKEPRREQEVTLLELCIKSILHWSCLKLYCGT